MSQRRLRFGRYTKALLFASVVLVMACDRADRIQAGMSESDVLRIMGRPSRTVESAARFRDEVIGMPECTDAAHRILVYHVAPRRRVRVVLDAKATVRCVVKTENMLY
jgi:hypothetical protein